MAVARKFIDKNVLRNVIRHTDAHNKIQEESEMWRLKQLQARAEDRSNSSSPAGEKKRKAIRYEDRMVADTFSSQTESSYWTKKLYKAEENDSERWGHSGYREMYPEEFDTNGSDGSLQRDEKDKKRKKKTKRSKEKKKRKKEKKEKSSRSVKRSKRSLVSDSEPELRDPKEDIFWVERETDKNKDIKIPGKSKVNGKTLKTINGSKRHSVTTRKKKKESKKQVGTSVKLKNQRKSEEELRDSESAVDGYLLPPAKRDTATRTRRQSISSDDSFSRSKRARFKSMQY